MKRYGYHPGSLTAREMRDLYEYHSFGGNNKRK